MTGAKTVTGNAEIVALTDYYAFGAKARGFVSETEAQQYGFHGMKRDNSVGNDDEDYTTEFRQYDSELGRWLSVDAYYYAMSSWSPYNFNFNNPINFIDSEGSLPWPILSKYIKQSSFNGKKGSARAALNFHQKRATHYHQGTDINWGGGSDDKGMPVVATAKGKVQRLHQDGVGAGYYLVVTHSKRYRTQYFHLDDDTRTTLTVVNEGDIIGEVSNTGTKHVHLHYELQEFVNGAWVSIQPYDDNGKLIDVQILVDEDIAANPANAIFAEETPKVYNFHQEIQNRLVAPSDRPVPNTVSQKISLVVSDKVTKYWQNYKSVNVLNNNISKLGSNAGTKVAGGAGKTVNKISDVKQCTVYE